MTKCPKCGKDFEGNVCSNCGYNIIAHPAFVPPIESPQPSYSQPQYQPQQYTCLLCGGVLTFVKEYAQWYCQRCRKYASEMPQCPVMTPPSIKKKVVGKRTTIAGLVFLAISSLLFFHYSRLTLIALIFGAIILTAGLYRFQHLNPLSYRRKKLVRYGILLMLLCVILAVLSYAFAELFFQQGNELIAEMEKTFSTGQLKEVSSLWENFINYMFIATLLASSALFVAVLSLCIVTYQRSARENKGIYLSVLIGIVALVIIGSMVVTSTLPDYVDDLMGAESGKELTDTYNAAMENLERMELLIGCSGLLFLTALGIEVYLFNSLCSKVQQSQGT